MNYWSLNAIFLAVVALVAIGAAVRIRSTKPWVAIAITLGVLLVMTAVFDNVMIGVGLVGYEPSLISGAFIGIAPLEDFAYAVAAAILLPSLWMLLPARERETRA
ncbi:lycopene cyclase domain-containing protein [Agreia sp. VKM Ac-1783]|uniref:lycopene cyclase domain-containing protein n=1 Tax=Agreia sp. VKM Ac-1783 TaxID=1938889 RepID=UPI000A2AC70C|nr:lycopene cyclase domain-containing protein [Agreia sp. VKM Ac-1783]SMQ71397.1 lycopene cyclase domain-containing protein [Agreia sp. VKM Ac-1783]